MKPIADLATICKCCGGASSIFGVVDLSKNCREPDGYFVSFSGIPIYYYKCVDCGFIFTRAFDSVTSDFFKAHIYNEDYLDVDPDYLFARPAANANVVDEVFGAAKSNIRVLDYGGGNGFLAEKLRDFGWANVECYDPFGDKFNRRPDGKFDLLVSFEVVEHSVEPQALINDMASFLNDDGLIFFSTLLAPDDIDKLKAGYFYLSPRNGHVCMHTSASLGHVFGTFGMGFGSVSAIYHVACREIPDFARHIFANG